MEQISVFDIFKIGVGPSSSHTMGPWRAAQKFVDHLENLQLIDQVQKIEVLLYGSLAKTGKGHGTDMAVQLALNGEDPVTINPFDIQIIIDTIALNKTVKLIGKYKIPFDPQKDILFLKQETLPFHANGISFKAYIIVGEIIEETYYSIGGGFVVQENESDFDNGSIKLLPYPIQAASDLLHWTKTLNKRIDEIVFENEKIWRDTENIKKDILMIWEAMKACIFKGSQTSGTLPGGLKVIRRAAHLHEKLLPDYHFTNVKDWVSAIQSLNKDFSTVNKWISLFALSVNEENAAFGRVVTAPTNGAAGVIPAVLMYYLCFCSKVGDNEIIQFLLTAGELGSIFKKGATISAAMGGCQAEIGVSSAMAAGALTACLGGTVEQSLMAAEIAMEHHLGLTCDPIGGLVQIPCIERNTMGAIKAITATYIALESNASDAKVSLDDVIKTMWLTALEMNSKYKETAEGGLAIQIPVNLSEC